MKLQKLNSLNSLTAALVVAAGVTTAARMEAAAIQGPNGNWYDVIAAPGISWDDANTAAEMYDQRGGWHLATVCDERENEFINSLRLSAGLGQVWLGGYQSPAGETTPGAGWTWVNNEGPIGTFFWQGGEPNDNYGPGSEQHLAMGLNNTSQWNDEGALGNIAGYVVERGDSHCGVPEGGASWALLGLGMAGVAGLRRRLARA